MKVGLVLGRFQPLHPGHLQLISLAFKENDRIIICIGSAQKSEPLTIEERRQRLERQLKISGCPEASYKIFDLIDPEPIVIWPAYVKRITGITDETENSFYRAEKLPIVYKSALEELGFRVVIIKRKPFYYKAPDGLYRLVSSGSEIRKIHRELGGII